MLCNFHGVRQEQDVKTTTGDSKLDEGATSTSQSPQLLIFSFLLFFTNSNCWLFLMALSDSGHLCRHLQTNRQASEASDEKVSDHQIGGN